MNFDFPKGPPGVHPTTAAMMRLLKFKGVKNPITDRAFSESLLLGIGGGIDTGYILYQFPHLPHPMLVLGFRNQWNNARAFLEDLSNRLLLNGEFIEFDKPGAAQEALQKALKQDKPALVWVDKAQLPYHHLPQNLKGFIDYLVTVYARDGRLWRLYLDDLSTQPIEIREKVFTTARGNLAENNYLMMIFNDGNNISAKEVREAIIDGIRTCADRLLHPIKTIGVSNLEFWAEKMTDRYDTSGWPQVFKECHGLFSALRTIYESIKLNGTEGFALRKLYADFLHEAAGMLDNPAFNAITGQYLQLANHWSTLAENALPSSIPEFDQVKSLLTEQYQAYRRCDFSTLQKTANEHNALQKVIISDFPLDNIEINNLFERLSRQIKLISELELSAAQRLRDITRR